MPFQHLIVIGFGLIGGSFAMAARQAFADMTIHAIDPDEETCAAALKQGTVQHASTTLNDIPENSLIVLACHISGVEEWLNTLAPKVNGRDVVVTDLSSVKGHISWLGNELLGDQFIGGHPMAGREVSGFESALPDLFQRKVFILCPMDANNPNLPRLQGFIEAIGMHTQAMDAQTHDRVMAYVSHFPHVYALLITKLLDDTPDGDKILECHAGGLADQLRLAASSGAMWAEVFASNQHNIKEVMADFGKLLIEASEKLDDKEQMQSWWHQANHVHDVFADYRRKLSYDPFAPATIGEEE